MYHKIDEATLDAAENLDLVMSMYNLKEYSSNCSKTTESLWFYSKDEASDFTANIVNDNNFKSSIIDTKLYVLVLTLSARGNQKL